MKGVIDTFSPGKKKTVAQIKNIAPFAKTLDTTVSAAYHDLPEEADAWATAGKAKAKYMAKK